MAIKLNITADEIELKTNRLESLDNVKEHEDGYPTGKATKDYVDASALTNKRVKFILADLGDTCSCGFTQSGAHILFMAMFDLTLLNVTIPQGYDYVMNKVEVDGTDVDLSVIDEYVKSMDNYSSDYGYGWEVADNIYIFYHEYNFGNSANAQEATETLNSDLPITGFSVDLDYYEQIQAELKEVTQ